MLSKQQQDIIENSIWVVNTALKRQGLQTDEDLRQSAILYMCKCLERFNPNLDIKWTTFAYKNVFLFIKRTHKKQEKRDNRIIGEDVFNLENRLVCAETMKICNAKQTINTIKSRCSEEERKFIDLKLQGFKGQEIAEIMNCNTSRVIYYMQSIKEKVRELNKKEGEKI